MVAMHFDISFRKVDLYGFLAKKESMSQGFQLARTSTCEERGWAIIRNIQHTRTRIVVTALKDSGEAKLSSPTASVQNT